MPVNFFLIFLLTESKKCGILSFVKTNCLIKLSIKNKQIKNICKKSEKK